MGDSLGGVISDFIGADRNVLADPFGDVAAAEEQAAAQKEALRQQEQLAQEAQQFFQQQSQQGIGYIQQGLQTGAHAISDYGQLGMEALARAQGQGAGALGAGQTDAMRSLGGGYDAARGDLGAGHGAAMGSLGTLQGLSRYGEGAARAIGSYDVAGQASNRLGSMLDQPGGLYGGFEADPGYQFRKQQGEQAINNAASARGGRGSARTMQELGEFNQGLASQEYGNYANRRQAEAGVASGADQYRLAALTNQAGRQDQASLAAQQNQMGLAGMGYGAYGAAAGMQSQYGQNLAGLSTGQGQQMAGYQSQYGQNLADLYGQYAGQNVGLLSGAGSQIGSMYANAGANMGNVAIGVGGNNQSNANSLMGAYQNAAQYGGMAQQAQANSNREVVGTIAAFASDRRLKTAIEEIPSKYERIGLKGYRWTWNERGNKLGLYGQADGVMAQDVKEVFPKAVADGPDGVLLVVYSELDRLVREAA